MMKNDEIVENMFQVREMTDTSKISIPWRTVGVRAKFNRNKKAEIRKKDKLAKLARRKNR